MANSNIIIGKSDNSTVKKDENETNTFSTNSIGIWQKIAQENSNNKTLTLSANQANNNPQPSSETSFDNSATATSSTFSIAIEPINSSPLPFRPITPVFNYRNIASPQQNEITLGGGGFGSVSLLETNKKSELPPKIALKKFTKNTSNVLGEAKIVYGINSPYIVKPLGVCTMPNNDTALLLEFCNGGNLRAYIEELDFSPYSIQEQIIKAQKIIEGVASLHARNIIHADLKPENILLHRNESNDLEPKIADFGVSIQGEHSNCNRGGTRKYQAPELQIGAGVEKSSDIYSLGILFIELFTAQMQKYNEARKENVFTQQEIDTTKLGKKLRQIIEACTNNTIEERPTIAELKESFSDERVQPIINEQKVLGAANKAVQGIERSIQLLKGLNVTESPAKKISCVSMQTKKFDTDELTIDLAINQNNILFENGRGKKNRAPQINGLSHQYQKSCFSKKKPNSFFTPRYAEPLKSTESMDTFSIEEMSLRVQ